MLKYLRLRPHGCHHLAIAPRLAEDVAARFIHAALPVAAQHTPVYHDTNHPFHSLLSPHSTLISSGRWSHFMLALWVSPAASPEGEAVRCKCLLGCDFYRQCLKRI